MTRQEFFRILGASVATVPVVLGMEHRKGTKYRAGCKRCFGLGVTDRNGRTGFESSAPGNSQVELIHDHIPEEMQYQWTQSWPYYNHHPFVELEWWMGYSRELVDDFNRLGWRFSHLPGDCIVLSLWEYSEAKGEGSDVSIMLDPQSDYITIGDSEFPSVVWEVKAVQEGPGVHGCVPWEGLFGDYGKTISWQDGNHVLGIPSFRFAPGEDTVKWIAEWAVAWLNHASTPCKGSYYNPSIRDGVRHDSVKWEVRTAQDTDSYTETFCPVKRG